LEAQGHVYQSHCDTETILHLYEDMARPVSNTCAACSRLRFGTSVAANFHCARSVGVKPLYFVHTVDGSLYFASEIKALLASRRSQPQINYAALPTIWQITPHPAKRLCSRTSNACCPGTRCFGRDGKIEIKRYWDVSFAKVADGARRDQDYIEEWTEMFRTSVRLRLMADVPLGMFLSGGIDSSAIAAVMSGMVSEPIKTFSVAFKEREANELEYARLVATTFKTNQPRNHC